MGVRGRSAVLEKALQRSQARKRAPGGHREQDGYHPDRGEGCERA
jgi:hypothetical protein